MKNEVVSITDFAESIWQVEVIVNGYLTYWYPEKRLYPDQLSVYLHCLRRLRDEP